MPIFFMVADLSDLKQDGNEIPDDYCKFGKKHPGSASHGNFF